VWDSAVRSGGEIIRLREGEGDCTDKHFKHRAAKGEAKQIKSSVHLDFRSLMTEAVISKVLRDRYCGITEIKADTTRTLLTLICVT